MKQKILKIMPLIVLLMAFIDTNYSLLQSVGIPTKYIDWIKLVGLLLVAYMPSLASKKNGVMQATTAGEEDDEAIGGGGIKNPPKP